MREFGCDRNVVPRMTNVRIEPALSAVRDRLVGGDYTRDDESGDAHRFTRRWQAWLPKGSSSVCDHGRPARGGRRRVHRRRCQRVPIAADACVAACGSWTGALLAPLGICLPLYPAKGYWRRFRFGADSVAPTVSLTDDGYKIVFSWLGQRLRIAGTAEFNGFNTELNPVRCAALMRRAGELFPDLRPAGAPEFWCGLRPATPSNVPLIGRSSVAGLWLATGHGTLGWTMACGTGAAVADLLSGRRPEPISFPITTALHGDSMSTVIYEVRDRVASSPSIARNHSMRSTLR